MTDEEKKRLKKAKQNLTLHVALIMETVDSKTDATALAYAEGPSGLAARRNPNGVSK